MAIDPVKIPQNIYVEDKIFGPVSLRQLIILLAGGGIGWVFWSIAKALNGGASSPTVTIICFTPLGIAAIFAFMKINGVSIFKLLLLMIERTDKPPIRVWMPRSGVQLNLKAYYNLETATNNDNPGATKKKKTMDRIEELSSILDKADQEEDPASRSYSNLVHIDDKKNASSAASTPSSSSSHGQKTK